MNGFRSNIELVRTRKEACRDRLINGAALYIIALLIMLQVDIDGAPLVEGWRGLNMVMLACFAMALVNMVAVVRAIVRGEA